MSDRTDAAHPTGQPTIDFWFDYTSPYAYLASERIESIAARHGRTLVWHPFLLGAVFKVTGGTPLTEQAMKGAYSVHDMQRTARQHDVPFSLPDPFPIGSVAAARATLWTREHDDEAIAGRTAALVHALYRTYFGAERNLMDTDVVLDAAASTGLPREALASALGDDAIKGALKREVQEAIDLELFGAPMTLVDGERFWGQDKLVQLDAWLERGGW